MIVKPVSLSKLKQLFLELFLNKTDKVSDISENSVLNATAFGVAKIGQKALKDIAVVESQIMPDSAYGSDLDKAATLFSSITRKTSSQSSTHVLILAEPDTFYDKSIVSFSNYNGITFTPENDLTINANGYGYLKVRSQDSGTKVNADPLSIITINSEPVGHIAVINEYMAEGGEDNESDELFRQRIKKHTNIVARYTEDYYTQILQQFNDDILKVITLGVDNDGKKTIGVVTQNGIDLSESELSELLEYVTPYLSIRDINKFGDAIGIKFVNVAWYYVGGETGIDFRGQLWNNYDPDSVRKNIQINLSKYLDFRYWKKGKKIDWDDLLSIVKNTEGVRYVADAYFYPRVDEQVPTIKLPRIKKFVMRALDGTVISDNQGLLAGQPFYPDAPIFYPNSIENE